MSAEVDEGFDIIECILKRRDTFSKNGEMETEFLIKYLGVDDTFEWRKKTDLLACEELIWRFEHDATDQTNASKILLKQIFYSDSSDDDISESDLDNNDSNREDELVVEVVVGSDDDDRFGMDEITREISAHECKSDCDKEILCEKYNGSESKAENYTVEYNGLRESEDYGLVNNKHNQANHQKTPPHTKAFNTLLHRIFYSDSIQSSSDDDDNSESDTNSINSNSKNEHVLQVLEGDNEDKFCNNNGVDEISAKDRNSNSVSNVQIRYNRYSQGIFDAVGEIKTKQMTDEWDSINGDEYENLNDGSRNIYNVVEYYSTVDEGKKIEASLEELDYCESELVEGNQHGTYFENNSEKSNDDDCVSEDNFYNIGYDSSKNNGEENNYHSDEIELEIVVDDYQAEQFSASFPKKPLDVDKHMLWCDTDIQQHLKNNSNVETISESDLSSINYAADTTPLSSPVESCEYETLNTKQKTFATICAESNKLLIDEVYQRLLFLEALVRKLSLELSDLKKSGKRDVQAVFTVSNIESTAKIPLATPSVSQKKSQILLPPPPLPVTKNVGSAPKKPSFSRPEQLKTTNAKIPLDTNSRYTPVTATASKGPQKKRNRSPVFEFSSAFKRVIPHPKSTLPLLPPPPLIPPTGLTATLGHARLALAQGSTGDADLLEPLVLGADYVVCMVGDASAQQTAAVNAFLHTLELS
ncbi:hypothetical protein HK100_008782 [Physocladia obscura]|uniref:Uncharacterized protein n=1 Tax=Physocladia obscura TaxID=109957 RepID=A0AAD5T4G0_9FUNG|nr:hypothetical protein HK100_008782 [Physocladia obscura]